MTIENEQHFVQLFNMIAQEIQRNSESHGFWEKGRERNMPEMICLMHSELSEALEAIRSNFPADKHCPAFGNFEIELADCIIRIMDLAAGFGFDVANAIIAKHQFNKLRPHKHGRTL